MTDRGVTDMRCSFCSKCKHEARILIASDQHTYICDACVQACVEIIAQHDTPAALEYASWHQYVAAAPRHPAE